MRDLNLCRNVSLDIETWGLQPGCDVRSVGACLFDIDSGTIVEEFYVALDAGGRALGLTRDPGTEAWWREQSEKAAVDAFRNPVPFVQGLRMFSEWYKAIQFRGDTLVWANDPHFDVAILDVAYSRAGLDSPWAYSEPRSFRTIIQLAEVSREERASPEVAHHALSDAVAQARDISLAWNRLKAARAAWRASAPRQRAQPGHRADS